MVFIFICNCNPNVNAEKVEKELLKIIDKLKMGKISQKDLQRVKIMSKVILFSHLTMLVQWQIFMVHI